MKKVEKDGFIWDDNWRAWFKRVEQQENSREPGAGGHVFGVNHWHNDYDVKKEFNKLEKLGAKIEVGYYENNVFSDNVRITVNKKYGYEIMSHILNKWPAHTFAKKCGNVQELEF